MLVHADGQDGVAEFLTQSRAEEKRAALERKIDADNEARRRREKAVAEAEAHMVKDANQKLEYALAEHQVKVIALFYFCRFIFRRRMCVRVCDIRATLRAPRCSRRKRHRKGQNR